MIDIIDVMAENAAYSDTKHDPEQISHTEDIKTEARNASEAKSKELQEKLKNLLPDFNNAAAFIVDDTMADAHYMSFYYGQKLGYQKGFKEALQHIHNLADLASGNR